MNLNQSNNVGVLLLAVGFIVIILVFVYLVIGRKRKQAVPAWKHKAAASYNTLITKKQSDKEFILDADKLLEFVLKQKFQQLEATTGEILKSEAKYFRPAELNDIWQAHKLRNNLMHNLDFQANPSEYNAAKIIFKKVLKLLID